jgi:hypothetical protein
VFTVFVPVCLDRFITGVCIGIIQDFISLHGTIYFIQTTSHKHTHTHFI